MNSRSFALLITLLVSSTAAFAATDPIEKEIGSAVGNFHAVESLQIYRGARPGDSGIQALARAGIKTVIDLQGGDTIFGMSVEKGESAADIAEEAQAAANAGIKFISEEMNAINPDTDDQSGTVDKVLALISDPQNQPVFFHCRHGSDRTGLIAALYRVLWQGCTPKQAHAEMMKYGHSSLLFWLDDYFEDRVANDPRTHETDPAPSCPLR